MSFFFYYLPCPLCQQDVIDSQPESLIALPLNPRLARMAWYDCQWDAQQQSLGGDHFRFYRHEGLGLYWSRFRAFLFHTRCFEHVEHLTFSQINLLVDLVEPTFLRHSLPPASELGGFSPRSSFPSAPNCQQLKSLIQTLPPEIRDMILQYDIERLLFVTRTASQIASGHKSLQIVPTHRLTHNILATDCGMVRIHLVDIGGRRYVERLTNVPESSGVAQVFNPPRLLLCAFLAWAAANSLFTFWLAVIWGSILLSFNIPAFIDRADAWRLRRRVIIYDLQGCNYLAVKTDGIGVVDIAFKATSDDYPEWILKSSPFPFRAETSIIKDADLRKVRLIRDSFKCRAIVPSPPNRLGPEPYFQSPFPPRHAWVGPGFYQGREGRPDNPFIYLSGASYIPFQTLDDITFDMYEWAEEGIEDVAVNQGLQQEYSVHFSRRPNAVKLLLCVTERNPELRPFAFPQFMVAGEWRPHIPPRHIVLRQQIWRNVLGIWFGKRNPRAAVNFGVVTSDEESLKNPVEDDSEHLLSSDGTL